MSRQHGGTATGVEQVCVLKDQSCGRIRLSSESERGVLGHTLALRAGKAFVGRSFARSFGALTRAVYSSQVFPSCHAIAQVGQWSKLQS